MGIEVNKKGLEVEPQKFENQLPSL